MMFGVADLSSAAGCAISGVHQQQQKTPKARYRNYFSGMTVGAEWGEEWDNETKVRRRLRRAEREGGDQETKTASMSRKLVGKLIKMLGFSRGVKGGVEYSRDKWEYGGIGENTVRING